MVNKSIGYNSQLKSVVGDFNDDNYPDIVVANYDNNRTCYSTGENSFPYSVTRHDLNKDNQTDVIVTNSGTNNVFVFYEYDNGTFAEPLSYFMGYESHPSSVVVSDFGDDGRIDIAVANYGTDNVEILFQSY
ncbi:unnamed protein product [Rotaria magnacalcarata]|uniref:VCBS repeat-containing protein n=1 Tax=Rotaria magnacalcarata TaxID=392030 RepID=A0A814XIS7_9BILA|nr:unnamed protein product [Rotaria magnacalcarata]CAF2128101.1 unnamed protein product [Rotaria magnacalcarata]CAF3782339.1 unnamed protein product [Rotaria magnacalcarata]CAF3805697.1 unnamed protein product [Rotaria magnacalcarata]CAF5183541.1 unnamed protein product [Rotaria magnacalcarata]